MDLCPSPHQQALIERAHRLAVDNFAPRAAQYDREATFADYADLHAAGLLALCVPEQYGGLGATFETYCLVAERLAQGNASTALTFNMHCLTMLMMGEMADALLLASTRVEPAHLSATGYTFRYPDLAGALQHLLGKNEAH